jgi:hypothetical protein
MENSRMKRLNAASQSIGRRLRFTQPTSTAYRGGLRRAREAEQWSAAQLRRSNTVSARSAQADVSHGGLIAAMLCGAPVRLRPDWL